MTVTNAKRIVQESQPRGRFLEGTLASGQTPKPGTFMKQDSSGNWTVGGPAADGGPGQCIILVEDDLQGIDSSVAYVDGSHCFLYIPTDGERLYCLVKNISGTGDFFSIGSQLMIEASTGKLLAATGTIYKTFTSQEAVTALAADTLCLVTYNG